ncbi:MFS transporter [Bailinhaonella thermotolerans]|uniref:MFS transporter n=1 Tax=Bailinhaonella thermotolerans TaxID=1070861 RepID=A0A3A4AXN1_9ACTN|nr:MFS transporter [Bailinhaonella thermotolerans]RJL24172.1 MFS transporter [Bailinhaonella thermotolerans]
MIAFTWFAALAGGVGGEWGAYRELLRLPGVGAQAGLGYLAQFSQQVATVGIVLVAQAATGSLAVAGAAAAGYSVATGIARPVQGRLIDRRGTRPVLAVSVVMHTGALLALVAGASLGWPGWALVVPACLAGAGLPPISVAMRVELGRRVPEGDRTSAYSLVYLVQELAILTGPLLFGLMIAAVPASSALAAVALLAGAGTLGFARALRGADPRGGDGARGSVLRVGRMRLLIAVTSLLGGAFGALEVGLPALAVERGSPVLAALLIAVLSVGGVAGALAYGSRAWPGRPGHRLPVLLLAMGLVLVPLPAAPLPALCVLLFACGVALNPALTTASLLVDEIVPRSQAEAFGWISTALGLGAGAGGALAGVAAEHLGPSPSLVTAAVPALAAAALALPLRP